jgi:hypothetical protein
MFSSYGTSEEAKIRVKELLDAEDIGHAAPTYEVPELQRKAVRTFSIGMTISDNIPEHISRTIALCCATLVAGIASVLAAID